MCGYGLALGGSLGTYESGNTEQDPQCCPIDIGIYQYYGKVVIDDLVIVQTTSTTQQTSIVFFFCGVEQEEE